MKRVIVSSALVGLLVYSLILTLLVSGRSLTQLGPLRPAEPPPSSTASAPSSIATLEFTVVPAYGSFERLHGRVSNVEPAGYRVAVVILVNGGWWTKPTFSQPLISIQPTGTFEANITTGGVDEQATRIVALLVPSDYHPPLLSGQASLPAELEARALARADTERTPAHRRISFSGLDWTVKASADPVGPGPNRFSDAADSVWVDDQDRLHLRITPRAEGWTCAEIVSTRSFGYGNYRFELDSRPRELETGVVLGLFTWDDDPAEAHRELDVELARWTDPTDPTNAQFVVQPYDQPGHLERFFAPLGAASHTFTWRPGVVTFESRESQGQPLHSWRYSGPDVPRPGGEQVRLNLWLFEGRPPASGQPVEIVVNRFAFLP